MQWLGVRTRGSFYFIRPLTVHGAACVAMEWPPRKFYPGRKSVAKRLGGRVRPDNARKRRMLSELRGLGVRIATQQDLDDANNNYDPSNDYNEEIPPAAKPWRRQNLVHFDIDPQNSMS